MSARRRRRTGDGAGRPSTAAVVGTAVGGLVAGVLYGLADRLPWWLWPVLIVVGLGVAYLAYRVTSRRAGPAAGSKESTA
jgi:hypothetical protein